MFAWDNTARRGNDSNLFVNFNLTKYKQWLSHVCHKTLVNDLFSYSEKFVFINAWNEWAEGTYLEPDRKYGYGGYKYIEGRWTNVAKKLIKKFNLKNKSKILDVGCGKAFILYEIKKLLPSIKITGFDISKYGIANAPKEIRKNLIVQKAQKKREFNFSCKFIIYK